MFILRNFRFVAKDPRRAWETIKAMRMFKASNPCCMYCGRRRKVDVHHKFPVSSHPELAADARFFRTLCRKPACHHVIGHLGNWRHVNEMIDKVLEAQK